MTAEKPKRQRRTEAAKLTQLAERCTKLRVALDRAEGVYRDALKAAHDKARAMSAALPPLEG